jgi:hypothetical protein
VPDIKGNFIGGFTAGKEETGYDKDYNPGNDEKR